MKRWKEYREEDIRTDSLWIIGKRGKGGKSASQYHGAFIPQIPEQMILRYTKKGETIWDAMAGCYDEETEILTLDGWKHFNDLVYEDRVATLNADTNRLEYHNPIRIIKRFYKGKMYRLKTSAVDLLVTKNHNLFIAFRDSRKPRMQWRFEFASPSKVFGKYILYKKNAIWKGKNPKFFILPSCQSSWIGGKGAQGKFFANEKKIKIEDWLKFFGLWLAEGSVTICHRGKGMGNHYQIKIKNMNNTLLDEIREVLQKMGFKVYKTNNDNSIIISNKQLYEYLSQFGKAWKKYVPNEIKQLSSKLLKVLFNYYIKGDGNNRLTPYGGYRTTWWTTSPRLRDDLQEICIKMGKSANFQLVKKKNETIKKIRGRVIKQEHPIWVSNLIIKSNTPSVYLHRNRRDNPNTKNREEWIDSHRGMVYCVEVPNHIVYVRRNGKAVWSGNSGTTGDVAKKLGRKCVMTDIKPVRKDIIRGDACFCYPPHNVQLVILHPPYWDIIKYSKDRNDLCNAETLEDYLRMFRKVIDNVTPFLDDGRFLALVIGDKYSKGEWIPLGFLTMNEVIKAGYILKSIIVKNMIGNERGKGIANNLWRYRALKDGFCVFKHEYVIVFQKKNMGLPLEKPKVFPRMLGKCQRHFPSH